MNQKRANNHPKNLKMNLKELEIEYWGTDNILDEK